MKTSKTVGIAVVAALVGSAVTLMLVNRVTPRGGVAQAHVVDAKGNLRVPENYRTLYQPLGTWAIAADSGRGSKEMHEVYASPGAIAAYRAAGHFPDGTVLVKEVFGTSTTGMTTGTVSHVARLKVSCIAPVPCASKKDMRSRLRTGARKPSALTSAIGKRSAITSRGRRFASLS